MFAPDVIVLDFDGTLFSLDVDWKQLKNVGREKLEGDAIAGRTLDRETVALLRKLQKKYRLAILSLNLTSTIVNILEASHIEGVLVLGRDGVERTKPACEGLERISDHYETDQLLMVGDSQADVECASTFGCPSVIVANPQHYYRPRGASRYVSALQELQNVLA